MSATFRCIRSSVSGGIQRRPKVFSVSVNADFSVTEVRLGIFTGWEGIAESDPTAAVAPDPGEWDNPVGTELVAAAGHACGIDFKAGQHLQSHPEFAWEKDLLRDMDSRPWTAFSAAK